MNSIWKIIIISIFSTLSFVAQAKPNHKDQSSSFFSNLFSPNSSHSAKRNGPPDHAKAWGRRNNMKAMTPGEKKALVSNGKNKRNNSDMEQSARTIAGVLVPR